MRSFFVVLLLGITGCASSPLPPASEVTKIDITITNAPADVAVETKKTTLDKRADINEVMAWLQSINWSQSGTDMAVIGIPQPDGGIVLTTKAGATQDYGFYWNGNFVNARANRLLHGADMTKWKQVVQRLCK